MVSQRSARVGASPTLEVTNAAAALRAAGKRVIAFAAGEPDLPVPSPIQEEAIAAIRRGAGRYTAAAGIGPLRETVARTFRELGYPFGPDQVIVCGGAKPAIFQALFAATDPGDEVLFPAPYWPSYPDICRALATVPVPVPAEAGRGFQVDAAALARAITPRSRALILNSPNNPTGAVYSRETLEGVARVVRESGLVVVSDDIYQHLVYDGAAFLGLLQVAPDLADRTVVVTSLSKSHSMTGWRIGFAGGPKPLIDAMDRLQSQIHGNANTITQHAAIVALAGPPPPERLASLDRRRRLILAELARIPKIACAEPKGAFYVLPDVSAYLGRRHRGAEIGDSTTLCKVLLEDMLVAAIPGDAFGAPGHIRLTYCCPDEEIVDGVARIGRLLASLT